MYYEGNIDSKKVCSLYIYKIKLFQFSIYCKDNNSCQENWINTRNVMVSMQVRTQLRHMILTTSRSILVHIGAASYICHKLVNHKILHMVVQKKKITYPSCRACSPEKSGASSPYVGVFSSKVQLSPESESLCSKAAPSI